MHDMVLLSNVALIVGLMVSGFKEPSEIFLIRVGIVTFDFTSTSILQLLTLD
jgi:hypothetical protein